MATSGETQIVLHNYTRTYVSWKISTDVKNKRGTFTCTQLRLYIRDISGNYYSSAANTMNVGVGVATSIRGTQKWASAINLSAGQSYTFNVTDRSVQIIFNSSGVYSGKSLAGNGVVDDSGNCYCHGYVCPSNWTPPSGFPQAKWYSAEAQARSSMPTIEVSPGTTTASLSSKTYNSITLSIKSTVATTSAQYRINGGTAVTYTPPGVGSTGGGTYSKTFSGLSPNTSYTIEVRHRRDYNNAWSSWAAVTTTTNKPAAPTAGSISLSSTTYNSIKVSASGFSFGAGGGWGYYQWYKNGSAITTTGSTASYTFTGLSPNTTYTLGVRLVDNYGSASSLATNSYKTSLPNSPTPGTVTASSITSTSITYSWSGFSVGAGASFSRYEYNYNDGKGWISAGTATSITRTGLTPNTSYQMTVRVVDNYSQTATSMQISTTTSKPPAGTAGTITVSSKTYNSITFSWSGFAAGAGGTISKYEYQWNGSSDWTDNGLSTSVQKTGLSPNTTYKIIVRAVDNYGVASATATLSDITPKPPVPIANDCTVDNITYNSATLTITASATSPATISSYKYKINDNTEQSSISNNITLTDLLPETQYTITYWVIDNYDQSSTVKTVSFTTLADKFITMIGSDGAEKKVDLWLITAEKEIKISKSLFTIIK